LSEQLAQEGGPSDGLYITFQVMAFAGVSAADQDTIGAQAEGL